MCEITNKKTTSCGHSFCKECITTWCRDNNSCPMCRKNILQEIIPWRQRRQRRRGRGQIHRRGLPQYEVQLDMIEQSISQIMANRAQDRMMNQHHSYDSEIELIRQQLVSARLLYESDRQSIEEFYIHHI